MRYILLFAMFLVVHAAGAQEAPLSLKKVVIALKPDKNPDQMMEEREALAQFLSRKLAVPVEVIIPLSASVILEGFGNGTVDLGYLSATDLIHAREQGVADLMLAGEIDGKKFYKSYWVALKERPYTSIEDLRGKPIAFSSKTSTSGYIIPLFDLKKKGLLSANAEEFFGKGNVWFGTGYVSAVERVLNGQAEAAAVSYYVLDKDKHLTADQRAKLKKVAEQGPVPTHVVAVRSSLDQKDQKKLRETLLSMNDPENTQLRDKVFTSKLTTADTAEHVGTLREAMDFAGSNE
jgi:phosphonate transport system substrate-binding protein